MCPEPLYINHDFDLINNIKEVNKEKFIENFSNELEKCKCSNTKIYSEIFFDIIYTTYKNCKKFNNQGFYEDVYVKIDYSIRTLESLLLNGINNNFKNINIEKIGVKNFLKYITYMSNSVFAINFDYMESFFIDKKYEKELTIMNDTALLLNGRFF